MATEKEYQELVKALSSECERLHKENKKLKALSQEPICIGKVEFDEDKLREIVKEQVARIEITAEQEPCTDAVSREAVCDYIAEFVNDEYSTDAECEMVDAMIEGIQHLPSVTHKSGKWIDKDLRKEEYVLVGKCSVCGQVRVKDKFCSNCGAEMFEPQESEDKTE